MRRRDIFPRQVTLIGNFICELTSEETIRWHRFISATPAFQHHRRLEREIRCTEAMVMGGDLQSGEKLRELLDTHLMVHDELWEIGHDWYEKLMAEDEAKAVAAEAAKS